MNLVFLKKQNLFLIKEKPKILGSGCWWLALDLHMVGLLGLEPTDNHNGRSDVNQQQPEPKSQNCCVK